MRILIVDDYADGLTVLSMLIKSMGHEVSSCAESDKCIACAKDFRPHLVLLDIAMRGTNGFDLLPDFQLLPFPVLIAALTGFVDPDTRAKCEALGFDYFVGKPASVEALKTLFASVERRMANIG